MNQLEATIISNHCLSENVYRMTLRAASIAKGAKPGQFVMIRVGDGLSPLLRRPFSIHQTINNKYIQILYKIVGEGTAYMAEAREGKSLEVLGPLGNGFHVTSKMQNCCLVGGGMGIAPLLFLAKYIVERSKPTTIKILLGAQSKNELLGIVEGFENMSLDISYATDDGSYGHHGYIVEILTKNLNNKDPKALWHIFSCGPSLMMKSCVEACNQFDWPCQVSMETMMACGISACLGCTIKGNKKNTNLNGNYLHVCQDGPVFMGNDIQW